MSEILSAHALSKLDAPLALTERKYVSGVSEAHDFKILTRFRELLGLHRRWGMACQRALRFPVQLRSYSWQSYAREELGVNESRQSLTHDAIKLRYLEGLNSGFALDLRSVHNSQRLWYFEDRVKYQPDCMLLLVKLLNQMRWCRQNDKAHLMSLEPGFPLMNYELGYGPTYPCAGESFGDRDEQMIVHDGKVLIYFELGFTGLTKGRVVSADIY